jgi:AcrR family transcriptional regulator
LPVARRILYESQLINSMAASRPAQRLSPTPVAERRPRGRPPVISTERLLEVARAVFLEFGIRATTLEVASRAGIAEGTIFTRFKSKADLFRAAMQFDPDEALAFFERLPSLAGQPDLRKTLVDFAEEFLRIGRVAVPVMMMSWSNPESHPCGEHAGERSERHKRVVAAITAFFQAEMRAGRVRAENPEVLARMLLGSLHQYNMSELLARDVGGVTPQAFARQVVDVLLAAVGVDAKRPSPAPARQRRARGSIR